MLTVGISIESKQAYNFWIHQINEKTNGLYEYRVIGLDISCFIGVKCYVQHKRSEKFVKLLSLVLDKLKPEIINNYSGKDVFKELRFDFSVNGQISGIIIASIDYVTNEIHVKYFSYDKEGGLIKKIKIKTKKHDHIFDDLNYVLKNIINRGG